MSRTFGFADLHCHPNLKTYGHSFDRGSSEVKQNVWHYQPPGAVSKLINILLGITSFTQADFTTLSKGGARIIFASLYPFEKGFFINSAGSGPLSAWLSDKITGIGYKRVRNLQKHTDYFSDLEREYQFFNNSPKSFSLDGEEYLWNMAGSYEDVVRAVQNENEIAVILTIEGAHVFNSGLSQYGRSTSEEEIMENIRRVKGWDYPPLFITFAHNFSNDFCGHAHSLEPIRRFVDQSKGLNSGFSELGKKVLHSLLSSENGRPVYIDIKHMSSRSRKEYFELLQSDYANDLPPTIVSHGAVNGLSLNEPSKVSPDSMFYPTDINFFDEEVVQIGMTGGLFAIQFDSRRIAKSKFVRKKIRSLFNDHDIEIAAEVIWNQIWYIAKLLDRKDLFAWGTACIGSDYDGTIDPLPGIWTTEYFSKLNDILLKKADICLNSNKDLTLKENTSISPEEIAERFFLGNSMEFLKRFY